MTRGKVMLAMLAMILISSNAFAEEPEGFKSAKFGMSITEAYNLGILKDPVPGPGLIVFGGQNEKIGGVEVSNVLYKFYSEDCTLDMKSNEAISKCINNAKLGMVSFQILRKSDAIIILQSLLEKYGEPREYSTNRPTAWIGGDKVRPWEMSIERNYIWEMPNVWIIFTNSTAVSWSGKLVESKAYDVDYTYIPALKGRAQKIREDTNKAKGDL